LGVIHRGFSTYEQSKYRNKPEWQIAIDFKNRFPDIPLIVDPSHISGNRDLIFEVAQAALDLNYDGLMIETHIDPDNAWSDAAQQVTPERLKKIIFDLTIRKITDEADDYTKRIAPLRAQIDEYDTKILEILGQRMKIADSIGALKKEKNVAVLQSQRWNEILEKMVSAGEAKGLSEEFILKIFKAIHQESIAHQENIINT
jgi:chorismate mutase